MDHICTGPSWSGCKCPPGLVREGDDCIDPDDCPCLHNGKMYESGASISRDCNTCICARRNWECSKPGFPGLSTRRTPKQSGKLWKTWKSLNALQPVLPLAIHIIKHLTARNIPSRGLVRIFWQIITKKTFLSPQKMLHAEPAVLHVPNQFLFPSAL